MPDVTKGDLDDLERRVRKLEKKDKKRETAGKRMKTILSRALREMRSALDGWTF